MTDREDLHLQDDPYLAECARWRKALGDARKPKAPPSRVPDYLLAIALGVVLATLAVYTAMG
jgi:cobalamin biosynthesis protein CobD/CbiB